MLLFSRSVVPDSLWPHGLQHTRISCPSPTPRSCSNSCPLSSWCHPNISSSVVSFSSCPQSFSGSGAFPMSWFFTSVSQSIGVTVSGLVLPMNILGWFSLELPGLVSLLSMGLSIIFSSTTVQKHQFFGLSLLYGPTFKSIHDHWKNRSFDFTDSCWQSTVSTF